jgi:hypothetical protein
VGEVQPVSAEQKKRRQRSKPAMVHTAVVLPPDMIEQLKQSDRGLSEEIRSRLARTLFEDTFDQRTRELAIALMELARSVQDHTGQAWHSGPQAQETLEIALQTYLAAIKPTAESKAVFQDDAPTLGRAIARNFLQAEALSKAARKFLEADKGEDQ